MKIPPFFVFMEEIQMVNKIVEDAKFIFVLRHNVLFAKKMDQALAILAKIENNLNQNQ